MSSSLNVSSGSGFDRSGRITSGRARGSVTTLAILVRDHRSYVAAWHRRQVWEPAYVRSADETCGAATRCGDGACDETLTDSVATTVAMATRITVNEDRMLI